MLLPGIAKIDWAAGSCNLYKTIDHQHGRKHALEASTKRDNEIIILNAIAEEDNNVWYLPVDVDKDKEGVLAHMPTISRVVSKQIVDGGVLLNFYDGKQKLFSIFN